MMETILFYDIETSGLNPAFDQVLTFACIRTDLNLVELSRETVTVRLRPDIVPSPGAFITHGLTRKDLDQGVCEYQAALKIHKLFNRPGTVSLGYNSLGFDDEFLRFLFYRNLLDPYSHQYANACSRMDLLPVAAVYWNFCPDLLSWPERDGRPTLKLEHISRANQFQVSGKAHEAMADVEALLSLARIFKREKKIWDYVVGFFDKKTDLGRIHGLDIPNCIFKDRLNGLKTGIMVSVSFGAKCGYLAPVLFLGSSQPYKNQTLWLRLDRACLLENIDEKTDLFDFFVIRKRPGDQLFVLPCLDRFWSKFRPQVSDTSLENLEKIKTDDGRFARTVAYHTAFKYPDVPDLDCDAALYQAGFFTAPEKQDIAAFHRAAPEDQYVVSRQMASARIRTLAMRIMARNFKLPVSDNLEFAAHLHKLAGRVSSEAVGQAYPVESPEPVKGFRGDEKLTCSKAMAEVHALEHETVLDDSSRSQLEWVKGYIAELSAFFADTV